MTVLDGPPRGRGHEAARLHARGTACAVLDWPLPPGDTDDVIRPDVAAALSHALAACGRVAFRCDDPHPGADAFPPRSPLIERLRDMALGWVDMRDGPFTVAAASDPATVAALFDYGGWWLGWQAALVFDPAANPAPVVAALRRSLDWRNRTLPPSARLLFGPGHDGAFAIAAAADPAWLARFKEHVQTQPA